MDLNELVTLNELKSENPYIALSIKNDVDLNDSFKRNVCRFLSVLSFLSLFPCEIFYIFFPLH
jgi:hypothetical protein